MAWKKFVILSLAITCVGCLKFYHHPEGGFRPKKPNFTLDKVNFIYSNKIDTLAIYVNTVTITYGSYKSVSYLKFYGNGRFFENTKNIGLKITSSNLRPLDIGYYSLNNGNLIIETYIVDPSDKRNTSYVKQKGSVLGDTIFLNSRFIKNKKYQYVKQKLDFVPEPSNW